MEKSRIEGSVRFFAYFAFHIHIFLRKRGIFCQVGVVIGAVFRDERVIFPHQGLLAFVHKSKERVHCTLAHGGGDRIFYPTLLDARVYNPGHIVGQR